MSTSIPENQIIATLNADYGNDRIILGCSSCQRVYLALEKHRSQPCPACGRAKLASQPVQMRAELPEKIIPHAITAARLSQIYTSFTQGVWLAPDDFKPDTLLQRTVPLYWSMWLVDCDVSGNWQAEMGYIYQVKSSKEHFQDNTWRSQQVIENRTRWEARLGSLERHYDNICVPANKNHAQRMKQLGNYSLDTATLYQPELLQTALIEVPDLEPETVWDQAKSAVNRSAGEECRQAAAADEIRQFAIHADHQNLHWTQQLLPMLASYYLDDEGKPQIVLVNGQTGRISGRKMASQKKGWRMAGIVAGIGGGILLLALVCFLLGMVFPPLAALAIFLAVVGFITLLGALIPAIAPAQINRKMDA